MTATVSGNVPSGYYPRVPRRLDSDHGPTVTATVSAQGRRGGCFGKGAPSEKGYNLQRLLRLRRPHIVAIAAMYLKRSAVAVET